MKPSGIGGQAVIEGVMMRNKSDYAIAVRTPDREIKIYKDVYNNISDRIKLFKVPVLRGIAAFIDSLVLGMRTLSYSAEFYDDSPKKTRSRKKESVSMGITFAISILIVIGLFVALPFFLTELFKDKITSYALRSVIEGVIRLVIFILYIRLITLMRDIRRVFMYHGAEHKVINCVEKGFELTVENAKRQSKEHKRCGTSFLLYVVILSMIFFVFIHVPQVWLRMLLRIVLVPLIAGVAYEFIRLAGRSDNAFVNILSRPGMWLQGLTTIEPDKAMLEVAIASVESVFDWREYQSGGSGRILRKRNIENKEEDFYNEEPEEDDIFSYSFEDIDIEEDDEEDKDVMQALDDLFGKYRNEDENP